MNKQLEKYIVFMNYNNLYCLYGQIIHNDLNIWCNHYQNNWHFSKKYNIL